MPNPNHLLGARAEDAVATWLVVCGWRLLACRYRSRHGGEVDLVMIDPERTLVGIEVRARSSPRAGSPEETVDPRRARRIARSLAAYAAEWRPSVSGLRVDLVAVSPVARGEGLRLRRLRDIASG